MSKKIVVGATGNLGAPVSVKLKADGYDVVAVGGRKNDKGFFQERGISYYSVNIKDKDSIYAIAKNAAVDLIEHCHATYGFQRFILRFFTIYEYHPNPYHYANFKRRMMSFRMLMDRAMKSLPIEIWGDCTKRKEMVYIKDFVQLVSNCVASGIEGGTYNVGNGWQVSLDEQIKGIVEVFSPKDNPSKIIYMKDKPDPLENAFDASKTFKELNWQPKYSYLDQLRDFKKEMAENPYEKLWGKPEDYHLSDKR